MILHQVTFIMYFNGIYLAFSDIFFYRKAACKAYDNKFEFVKALKHILQSQGRIRSWPKIDIHETLYPPFEIFHRVRYKLRVWLTLKCTSINILCRMLTLTRNNRVVYLVFVHKNSFQLRKTKVNFQVNVNRDFGT